MVDRLAGKRIFITGAAQGIGLAISKACLDEGAHIFMVDLEVDQLKEQVDQLNLGDGRIGWCKADIAEEESILEAVAVAESKFGSINTLVNNAGINVFHEPLETTNEEWDRCFDVNLRGAWFCCKALLGGMIESGNGVILNIASVHSFSIIPQTFPYPVAKHALIGMTKSLALEYAIKGVRVNALAPGYVETQKVEDYWNSFPDPLYAKAKTLALQPGGRIATAREIALAAVFLVSDECPFINAACLTADGGLSSQLHPL
jgi:NAD(P)-dependent dehydrogenase (short-subunit alcohol dehydrogenase family)